MPDEAHEQPFLHGLVTALRAPVAALGGADGQLREDGVQGVYAFDRRLVRALLVTVDGREPVCLRTWLDGASTVRSSSVVRGVGDLIPDPTVLLERTRAVFADRVVETLTLRSRAQVPVRLQVAVRVSTDLGHLDAVKQGSPGALVRPSVDGSAVGFAAGLVTSRVAVSPVGSLDADVTGADLGWDVALEPGEQWQAELVVTGTDAGTPVPFGAAPGEHWPGAWAHADDRRVDALTARGLADLQALLMSDGDDVFAAAGSPWFFTLFGRDSLWTARLLLPFGTDLAMGTLRTLARRQGSADVQATEEQPGKILHEVRRDGLDGGGLVLPPVYFGTVDATPLWVALLVDAWRFGADPEQVRALLPAAEAAMGWVRRQADDDPTGFVRYLDRTGTGLANQGWKDSGDSVQWADGRLADAPIALSEVQAYAHEAAVGAADLLDAFGRPGGDELRGWAAALAARFRDRFWVEDALGDYPAIALDGDGKAVDGVASNMGHLLGTGLLDAGEAATVARRLAGPDLDSGYGLRTITARSPRFSPLSYHGGAVWPHDTAIAARGLALEGHDDVAASLLAGLVAASDAFAARLPELLAGVQADASPALPYPASCRPQAWSAAAGTCVATLALGLRPDVPNGRIDVRPLTSAPWGALEVTGLRLGDHALAVTVGRDGVAHVTSEHPGVAVVTGQPTR